MKQRKPISPDAALSRLQTLCAGSEQCSADLRKKLSAWGVPVREAEEIIRNLGQTSFLSDARYARAFAHDKLMFNGWGRFKIIQGLRAKGIDRELIDEALEAIDPSAYRKRAFAVMRARASSMEPTHDNRMRLLRFGSGRGFEASLLIKIIKSEALWKRSDR